MAASPSVGKLRQVLDYWTCDTCLKRPTREQEYFCAVCRRLQRNVALRPRPAPVRLIRPRGATTKADAVQVIPPEEWEAARTAAQRGREQELELARLQQREEELASEVARLQEELDALREQPASAGQTSEEPTKPVRFELVEVRKKAAAEPEMEFAQEFEEVEEAAPEPFPEATSNEPEPSWLELPEGGEETKPLSESAHDLEREIHQIEKELADIAEQERELGGAPPYRFKGYTLYVREVRSSGKASQPFYFFSRAAPREGAPAPMPVGYVVAQSPRTGLPYLKKEGKRSNRRKKK